MKYIIKVLNDPTQLVVDVQSQTIAEMVGRGVYGASFKDVEIARCERTHPSINVSVEEYSKLIESGFEDVSWKNDELPSFKIWVGCDQMDVNNLRFALSFGSDAEGTHEDVINSDCVESIINNAQVPIFEISKFDKMIIEDGISLYKKLAFIFSVDFQGSEEEIALNNMIFSYAEKCGIWDMEKEAELNEKESPEYFMNIITERINNAKIK